MQGGAHPRGPEIAPTASDSPGADQEPPEWDDTRTTQRASSIEMHLQTQPNDFITAVENDLWIILKQFQSSFQFAI